MAWNVIQKCYSNPHSKNNFHQDFSGGNPKYLIQFVLITNNTGDTIATFNL